jgi:eukaryotic-like serine/threonine-protein kinase
VAISSLAFMALGRRAESRATRVVRSTPYLAQPSVVVPHGAPIAVKVVPGDAVVRLNGAVIGVGEQLIARPAPGGSLTVEVTASGVGARKVVLTSESPDEIELHLGDR